MLFIIIYLFIFTCVAFFISSVCYLIFFLFFADDLCTLIIIVVGF